MVKPARITPEHFKQLYAMFDAPVSKFDCGRKCAPLNGGQPVCCTTDNAIPVVDKAEYKLLRSRTDLWGPYTPNDAASRKIVDELSSHCRAIECKGAAFCERDNRTIACRTFPFFPYITREGEFIGFSFYWDFEDRCWVISNLGIVEREFLRQMTAAMLLSFETDPEEYDVMKEHSANMRRVFSRRQAIIPLLGRPDTGAGLFKVMPYTGEVRVAKLAEFKPVGVYKSEAAYKRAVKAAGGTLGTAPKGGYLAP